MKYVEPLIGPHTINTIPLETLEAYRDHGNPQSRLEQEAVEKFNQPPDKLMKTLAKGHRRGEHEN